MENRSTGHQSEHYFSDADRDAVYKSIYNRRDVRGQFKPDRIPDDVLARLLKQPIMHPPSASCSRGTFC